MSDTFPATLPDLPARVVIPADIDERAGFAILAALVHRFGWACAVWDRQCIDALPDQFDLRFPPEGGTYRGRGAVTDEQWQRVTQTRAWREGIRDVAYDRVANGRLLYQAVYEAGLVCDECGTALADPPTVTGRLCEAHRTGPHGQPAVVNPATEGLYWLQWDTLFYAPTDWEHSAPCKDRGRPVDWNDLDPLGHLQATTAEQALRARQPAFPTRVEASPVEAG
jgi:hypothetical protein